MHGPNALIQETVRAFYNWVPRLMTTLPHIEDGLRPRPGLQLRSFRV